MRNSRRIMLRLSLGILCGLILILLPAFFFSGPTNSPTTDTCSNCYLITAKRPVPVAGPAALTFNPIPGLTLLEILFLILLPSLVFSILAMRWARTRTGAGEDPFE